MARRQRGRGRFKGYTRQKGRGPFKGNIRQTGKQRGGIIGRKRYHNRGYRLPRPPPTDVIIYR